LQSLKSANAECSGTTATVDQMSDLRRGIHNRLRAEDVAWLLSACIGLGFNPASGLGNRSVVTVDAVTTRPCHRGQGSALLCARSA
jgi:hypothetical protein